MQFALENGAVLFGMLGVLLTVLLTLIKVPKLLGQDGVGGYNFLIMIINFFSREIAPLIRIVEKKIHAVPGKRLMILFHFL